MRTEPRRCDSPVGKAKLKFEDPLIEPNEWIQAGSCVVYSNTTNAGSAGLLPNRNCIVFRVASPEILCHLHLDNFDVVNKQTQQ